MMSSIFCNIFFSFFIMSVIGKVSVFLKKADITQEKVDVIVNSSNQNLDLNTGNYSLLFSDQYFKVYSAL